MKGPFDVWLRRIWLWAPPLVLCLVGLLAFTIYRTNFAGRVESMEDRTVSAADELASLRQERQKLETFLERAASGKSGIAEIYMEHFSTQPRRFTRMIDEVKKLARQAGLNPQSFNYPQSQIDEYDLVRREVNFRVEGSYEELRSFINFLELTDQFLALTSITLSDGGGDERSPRLGIGLSLSTVFAAQDAAVRELEGAES